MSDQRMQAMREWEKNSCAMSVATSKPTFPVLHATPSAGVAWRYARASDWGLAGVRQGFFVRGLPLTSRGSC